jgi:hypothetical protein
MSASTAVNTELIATASVLSSALRKEVNTVKSQRTVGPQGSVELHSLESAGPPRAPSWTTGADDLAVLHAILATGAPDSRATFGDTVDVVHSQSL